MRWIGCAAVWEAGRAVCGERHLEQTQAYSPTATEVGRGNIHTYAITLFLTSTETLLLFMVLRPPRTYGWYNVNEIPVFKN